MDLLRGFSWFCPQPLVWTIHSPRFKLNCWSYQVSFCSEIQYSEFYEVSLLSYEAPYCTASSWSELSIKSWGMILCASALRSPVLLFSIHSPVPLTETSGLCPLLLTTPHLVSRVPVHQWTAVWDTHVSVGDFPERFYRFNTVCLLAAQEHFCPVNRGTVATSLHICVLFLVSDSLGKPLNWYCFVG